MAWKRRAVRPIGVALAMTVAAGFGLANEAMAGCHGGGVVTVGGPSAAIASPPWGFYGGFSALPAQPSLQSAQARPVRDAGVVRTAYQEPAEAPADGTPEALTETPAPPTANQATAPATTAVQQIPRGAINYNNGYEYLSPAAILAPGPEGPTSGHKRRWIRFYFPPGMTYFHDQGYGY